MIKLKKKQLSKRKMSSVRILTTGTRLYSVAKPGDNPRVWFLNKGKALFWGVLLHGTERDLNSYLLKEVVLRNNLEYLHVKVDKSFLDRDDFKAKKANIFVKIDLFVYGEKVDDIALGFSDVSVLGSERKEYTVEWRRVGAEIGTSMQRNQSINTIKDSFQTLDVDPYLKLNKEVLGQELIQLQQRFETMDANVIKLIAVKLDPSDVLSLCRAGGRFNDVICNDRGFWRQKLKRDFPDVVLQPNENPRIRYKNASDPNLTDITDLLNQLGNSGDEEPILANPRWGQLRNPVVPMITNVAPSTPIVMPGVADQQIQSLLNQMADNEAPF